MWLKLDSKKQKMLHPTLGWLDEIQTIKYHTSLGKRYPYEVTGFQMLFNKELKAAYEENLRVTP